MATTTQILFNSPALHSLKRDQLVKLCKTHSLKANGKNTELIERLKQHAQALPPDALTTSSFDDEMDVEDDVPGGFPVDSAFQGGDEEQDDDYAMQDVVLNSRFGIPRPSEQWEVVMDDIAEVDESGVGTMSSKGSLRTVSNGEFGTHTSKGSVTSSLKALATSLGIKRAVSKSGCNQDNDDGSVNSKEREPTSFSPGKLFSVRARDSLAEHATPYSRIPPSDTLPETDHFKFSTPDASMLGLDEDEDAPVPGTSTRSGRPAPLGARLSMGVGQSTIRLVTAPAAPRFEDPYLMSPPHLAAIQPEFDIKMGTPSAGRILNVWPASPRTAGAEVGDGGAERLYPRLPLADFKAARDGKDDDGDEGAPMPGGMFASASTPARTPARTRTATDTTITAGTPRTTSTPRPVDEPDMFSPSKPTAPVAAAAVPHGGNVERPSIPRSAPFLFGSPLPRRDTPKTALSAESDAGVSNIAFEGAAKSVLEEMHRRLAEAQKEKEKNGEARPAPPTQTAGDSIFGGLLFGGAGAAAAGGSNESAADRYAKAHEAQFAKMDSIASHYAARRPAGNTRKRKSEALGPGARAGQKRRSSAAGTRVISNGARKRGVPGGFGAEDEEEESEAEEEAGEEKVNERDEDDMGARRSSKRMRIAEGWDVHRGQRVSLAPPLPPAAEEKKARERDAVKRELDAAKARRRSSRGRVSMGGKAAPPAKGKASRFGFLSSAKSIVKNVWGFGGKTKTAAAEKAPPSSIPVPKAVAPTTAVSQPKKADAQKLGNGVAPATANAAAAQNGRKPSGTHSRIPSVSSTTSKLLQPSSAADAKTIGTVNSARSSSSRARSPIPSFTQAPPAASRPSSIAGTARSRVSSTAGTATSTSRQPSRTSTVSSMGTRTSLVSGASSSAAVSSIGTRRSVASANTLASTSSKADKDGENQPTVRKRTSSLLAPTASSLAKVNTAMRPSVSGRTSGLPSVLEKQSSIPRASKSPIGGRRMSPMSPSSERIFSQPLTNFGSPGSPASPAYHPSLGAAASALFSNVEDSSPSKIPRPAVLPPKPKALVARKPRISRSRVIAKVGAQRAAAAAAQGSASSPTGRTRSSFGARKSFGGVKSGRASAGAEVMRGAAKKRARQSEYMRRKSRAAADSDA
ncbi:hypothetical protein TRAPUB_11239 [Trametes pubescens]|uniref:SAP domain-containing protein n=1 Tax=Trametes pubescens TaxID=154538 RepID=A0A1M2VXE9_TRAPU|nr:hypothetical protein TRAPUB_11239 [Trametes pubescens]